MDATKLKKVGTREEVYKGLSSRTAGGLKKDDIIEKIFGTRTIYISKKLSDKMKINVSILRANNPNFIKKLQKQTMVNTQQQVPSIQQQVPSIQQQVPSIQQQEKPKQIKKLNIAKTQKLSFKIKDNSVRTVFYPELKGLDLKALKDDLLQEEAEEDLGVVLPKKLGGGNSGAGKFVIDELPDFDLNSLE